MSDARHLWIRKALLYALLALTLVTLQHRLRGLTEIEAGGLYDVRAIAEFRSKPPYQRRVLIPLIVTALERGTHQAPPNVELEVRWIGLTLALLLADAALAAAGLPGVVGALLFAALIPLGFYVNRVFDSYWSVAVLLAGIWWIRLGRWGWLPPLVLAGSFIRETPILLVPLLGIAAYRSRTRPAYLALGAATLALIAARALLSWWFPGPSFEASLSFNIQQVMSGGLADAALRVVTVLGPAALAGLAWSRTTGFARDWLTVGLLYSAMLPFLAHLNEPRAFWEAYALVLPGLVCYISVDEPGKPAA